MKKQLYPLFFQPILKKRLWGGQALSRYNKELPAQTPIGESWDISDHSEGHSIIMNGPLKGTSISAIFNKNKEELMGKNFTAQAENPFPLLVKWIDANQLLSVQVHPTDEDAIRMKISDPGKTEFWHIIDAEPGAYLIKGWNQKVSPEIIEDALNNKELEKYLKKIPVQKGDTIFVPAGHVHSIGPGLIVCEIQQNSDTTFRLYDWNRTGTDGKPRMLHVKQALEVLDFNMDTDGKIDPKPVIEEKDLSIQDILDCPYFSTKHYQCAKEITLDPTNACRILTFTEGTAIMRYQDMEIVAQAGDSCILPASIDEVKLTPDDELIFLETVPK